MGDIMKNLVSRGSVMNNIDLYLLMKEAREAHLLTINTKTSVDDAISQATSTAVKVGSVSATLTQLLTPGAGGRLGSMHHSLNMGYQNIGVLQQTLTGFYNVVGTLEHNMHNLSQHDTARPIKDSSTIAPKNDFDVQILTLAAELDGVRQLTEGFGFNTLVGNFKSLTDVTVWVRANLPSDAPKFEHFIDLYILLAGIRQKGVSSEEVWNKEVHADRVKRSMKHSVVVT